MIEEIKERRIKYFEIVLAIIIAILLIWLLSYEFFFKSDETPIIDDDPVEETNEKKIDESNIYDTYSSVDRKFSLIIVKTNDRKAYEDAKEKYLSVEGNKKYRNKDAIYYGYLNDLIFEITDINEDVKYSLVKGKLIDKENDYYNFIINKETKVIEENPLNNSDDNRFFNDVNSRLYSILKVDGKYFFKETISKDVSILYTNSWNKLGYVSNDYIIDKNEITTYEDETLSGNKNTYDLDGNLVKDNN